MTSGNETDKQSSSGVHAVINVLGRQVLNHLSKVNWQFESDPTSEHEPVLPRKFHLMLDKDYFPKSEVCEIHELQRIWSVVAGCAASYAYKTIGAGYSKAMKVWLANAASTAIIFSLIGEIPRSEEKRSETVESVALPDSISIDEADGNWFYGTWTKQNLASESEMQTVIQPKMTDACLQVMIASVVNFYQNNRYTPPSKMSTDNNKNSSYAARILKNASWSQYGIADKSDRIKIMKITGQWISRIHVFNVFTCLKTLKHPLKYVRVIGMGTLPFSQEVKDQLSHLPSGWKRTEIAEAIARKLVNSNLFHLFRDVKGLISLRSRIDEILQDPFYYHPDSDYLIKDPLKPNSIDDANNLLGRLITYLKYSEPDSELFNSAYLKVGGRTREKDYNDYSENWEILLKKIYTSDASTRQEIIDSEVSKLKGTTNHFRNQQELLNKCFKLYNVQSSY
uniref:Uncharacterized protein n=1 Tax=Trichobilharzia regenti TaxID=157069 RepID=A0AA85IT14_TRIRE|nr:unnamed protein product [Trichobilharzia regenti]